MNKFKQKTKDIIFSFFMGGMSSKEFELFIYKTKEVKNGFSENDYLNLISINFNKESARREACKIIEKNIDRSEYETWKVNNIFNIIINKSKNYPQCIAALYGLYCNGYYFMQNLGINYGLPITLPKKYNFDKYLSELDASEQIELAAIFYPSVIEEVKKVQNFIRNKKIILTGESNELGYHYEYIDKRSDEEKAQTECKILK